MSNADLLAAGRQSHQSGDLSRAEAAFCELLKFEPANPEAWQALGSVYRDQRRHADAVAAFERARDIDPHYAQAHNMLGITLLELGRLAEAAGAFQAALRARPDFAIAYNNLGNVELALGRTHEALASYQEAVRLKPDFAEAQGNLGNVLRELGRLDEALACCTLALRLKPTFVIGHNHLGAVYSALRRWNEAAACFRQAISLHPSYLEARVNLSDALREQGRHDEAESLLRETQRLHPDSPDVYVSLSLLLLEQAKLEAAEEASREALRRKPDSTTAHLALGMSCHLQGRPQEAVACYDRALEIDPESPEAHKNRGIVRLQVGDFAGGWDDYEWRWRCPELSGRRLAQPLWEGSPLQGKTILLHAEQGLGDTIQFVRYAPLVRERGGRVVLACQRSLVPLLRSCRGIDQLIALDDPPPAYDVHAPLLSLPRIFQTGPDTIPADVPYIAPDPGLVAEWGETLKSLSGFKVGIVWSGSPDFRFNRFRSVPLAEFRALADVPGVTLISLQKGQGSEQIAAVADRFRVVDLGERLDATAGAFMDTAAILQHLDLVVACDTAVAHLAGALARDVWLTLPYSPDWRWMRDRDDSLWYPTMRLFRQQHRGDWEGVFRSIAAALAERMGVALPARPVTIEVSPGELLDKITILEIKSQRMGDEAKLANVRVELAALVAARDRAIDRSAAVGPLAAQLKQVNEALWEIEDEIRVCERAGDFGPRFIELARSVYQQNDRRAELKREINQRLGSRLIEEKSYEDYRRSAK
ncbi:MAG TPA: DUF6165 family protein [Pirellulales bacterium]|nr:DUF6165 family protein [Pirellulales bacterium]